MPMTLLEDTLKVDFPGNWGVSFRLSTGVAVIGSQPYVAGRAEGPPYLVLRP